MTETFKFNINEEERKWIIDKLSDNTNSQFQISYDNDNNTIIINFINEKTKKTEWIFVKNIVVYETKEILIFNEK